MRAERDSDGGEGAGDGPAPCAPGRGEAVSVSHGVWQERIVIIRCLGCGRAFPYRHDGRDAPGRLAFVDRLCQGCFDRWVKGGCSWHFQAM